MFDSIINPAPTPMAERSIDDRILDVQDELAQERDRPTGTPEQHEARAKALFVEITRLRDAKKAAERDGGVRS